MANLEDFFNPSSRVKSFLLKTGLLLGGVFLTGIGGMIGFPATMKILNLPWTIAQISGVLLLVLWWWAVRNQI